MKNLKFIQNRNHWCWAVACKLVGEQYKKTHPEFHFSIINEKPEKCGQVTLFEYENGVVTENREGLSRWLSYADAVRVDAWQRAIVMNANTCKYIGYDGDAAGNDEAKVRGIKYYLTGDIYSDKVCVETLGYYDDPMSLWDQYRDRIMESFRRQEYIIGNVVLHTKNEYHSIVILCIVEDKVMLYNTVDGELLYYNTEDVFCKGFKSCLGIGTVKWIQRIV